MILLPILLGVAVCVGAATGAYWLLERLMRHWSSRRDTLTISRLEAENREYREALHNIRALSRLADPTLITNCPPSVAVALDDINLTAVAALRKKELSQ